MRTFIAALVRDVHLQEDLLQETALAAWSKYAQYDASRPFGAWLRGIAANEMKRSARDSKRAPTLLTPEAIDMLLRISSQMDDDVWSSPREALDECIRWLSPRQRQLILMRYEQALRPSLLSQRLGCSLVSIYKMLARVRQRLSNCVQRKLEQSNGVSTIPISGVPAAWKPPNNSTS